MPPSRVLDLSPQDALSRKGQLRFVDVRELGEYVGPLGHIAGAELVPLGQVVQAASEWPREQPLLLICHSGGRSGRAAAALTELGFGTVYNLVGGMLAWEAAGLPRVHTPPGTP
jgi:rhodanese-related sulfurtransferase